MSETVTALEIISRAYQTLGVQDPSESVSAALGQFGFWRLNRLVAQWAAGHALTIPTSSRTVIPIVLGKGTEANPITIGPTGDVVMTTRPLALESAGLLLAGTAPRVEIERAVYTDAMWNAIAVKDMTSSLFTGVYYTPAVPNGEIILWPVPDTAIHSLVIYRGEQVPPFANLSTSYVLPDGYVDALEFNLAVRLGPGSGVQVTPELQDLARSSLATIKRGNNTTMTDLANDFAFDGGDGYNILTGNL
jgi:hypothetical protein